MDKKRVVSVTPSKAQRKELEGDFVWADAVSEVWASLSDNKKEAAKECDPPITRKILRSNTALKAKWNKQCKEELEVSSSPLALDPHSGKRTALHPKKIAIKVARTIIKEAIDDEELPMTTHEKLKVQVIVLQKANRKLNKQNKKLEEDNEDLEDQKSKLEREVKKLTRRITKLEEEKQEIDELCAELKELALESSSNRDLEPVSEPTYQKPIPKGDLTGPEPQDIEGKVEDSVV